MTHQGVGRCAGWGAAQRVSTLQVYEVQRLLRAAHGPGLAVRVRQPMGSGCCSLQAAQRPAVMIPDGEGFAYRPAWLEITDDGKRTLEGCLTLSASLR